MESISENREKPQRCMVWIVHLMGVACCMMRCWRMGMMNGNH
jgi:hypothetical protein